MGTWPLGAPARHHAVGVVSGGVCAVRQGADRVPALTYDPRISRDEPLREQRLGTVGPDTCVSPNVGASTCGGAKRSLGAGPSRAQARYKCSLSADENAYTVPDMAPLVASGRRTRRWGAGTTAVIRLLTAADRPLTGVAIAEAVGVTQPRASQILQQLAERGAVSSSRDGYVGHRARLLDLYARHTGPHLVEPETRWYSVRAPAEQAIRVVELSERSGMRTAVSADLGPDLLTPWRHPTTTIVYSAQRLGLEEARFTPVDGRGDATLIVRWTKDQTLLAPFGSWPRQVDGIPLTDPVQQWADLLDLGGNDRQEAADRLRHAILRRDLHRPA
jgi:DNA-binding transcriptional ArsR family regulator